ncbi:MAG: hypothetical protein ACOYNY_05260 [Caldilineaceae bacterium]
MLSKLVSIVRGKFSLFLTATMLLGALLPHSSHSNVQAQSGSGCSITIGADGESKTYTTNGYGEFNAVMVSNFVRDTDGFCTFIIYNDVNFGGLRVVLGTDLQGQIRAGLDGVEKRKHGGGDTWRIRSLKIVPVVDKLCKLVVGGNGVRMTYYNGFTEPEHSNPGYFDPVPAMDRAESFEGPSPARGDETYCSANLYVGTGFTWNDLHYPKTILPFGPSLYKPGFRVRSFKICLRSSPCPVEPEF